ncbi:MAG: hypothetical protein GY710_12130 [Desulfobacteraceae bacterium]|nr:hypothetical protein [Desulfobacteraceae bacterium]
MNKIDAHKKNDIEKLNVPDEVKQVLMIGATVLMLTGENDDQYYFKKPKPVDLNRFLATSSKGKLAAAVKNLIFELAVKPTSEELKTEFKDKPGRMIALNNALQGEIGLNEDFAVKKL